RVAVEFPRIVSGRALWLVHRHELIRQAAEQLRAAGYDVGCISPLHEPDQWAPVQVASVDTLLARNIRPEAALVVWDECHHSPAETYRKVLEPYDSALHVGLTATPQRRDGKPLGDLYDALVVGAQYSALIADG